jgi:hypothetical protein
MIIPDIREYTKNKGTTEYRAMLMAAVHAEVLALQAAIDAHERKHASAKANKDKRLLMTIFALLEQIPWLGLDATAKGQGIEQRAKDTLRTGGPTADA